MLLLVGAGLAGCVPVGEAYYPTPYGGYAGDGHFVTAYVYRGGPDGYLYRQARPAWRDSYHYRPRYYDDRRRYYGRRPYWGGDRNRHWRRRHDNGRDF